MDKSKHIPELSKQSLQEKKGDIFFTILIYSLNYCIVALKNGCEKIFL